MGCDAHRSIVCRCARDKSLWKKMMEGSEERPSMCRWWWRWQQKQTKRRGTQVCCAVPHGSACIDLCFALGPGAPSIHTIQYRAANHRRSARFCGRAPEKLAAGGGDDWRGRPAAQERTGQDRQGGKGDTRPGGGGMRTWLRRARTACVLVVVC